MTLGSTLVYYGAIEVTMAHGIGAAALAALVWFWLKTYNSPALSRWFTVGLLLGAAALVRWQLITFALLPLGEALLSWGRLPACPNQPQLGRLSRSWKNLHPPLTRLTLAAAGALIAFLPQMIAWRYVYGHWLVEPVPQVAHHWLSPSLWEVLLSTDRSLFYWTPVCALACLGFFLCRPAARAEPLALLFAAFGVQVVALAGVWGKGEYLEQVGNFGGAFLSRAYGMRQLTETVVVLAPGLALLLERAGRWPFRLLCGLGFVLGLWNLLLICQYNAELLPTDAGIDPRMLLATTLRFVETEPWIAMLLVEAVGLIWLVLLWGNEEAAVDITGGNQQADQQPSGSAAVLRWGTLVLLAVGLLVPAQSLSARVGFLYRVSPFLKYLPL